MYKRNNGRTRKIFFALTVAAMLFVALVYLRGPQNLIDGARRLALSATAPLQKVVFTVTVPIRRISQYTLVVGDLTKENQKLKRDNIKLRQTVNLLKRYKTQNRQLLKLAGFREALPLNTVGARVISRSPTSWQSIITIDLGSVAGIHDNMAVITDKGLVGRTARTVGSAALVQMLDDRRSGVGVEVVRTGATGIVEGSMEGRLKLRFLGSDADIKVGDKLRTSGVGGVYPRGISVGTVSGISKTAYSLEKDVNVKPAVDYSRLSEVLVIKRKKRPEIRL
jgi:rod shape-determining protein MreC